jgi:hypothetical protein
MPVVIKKSSLIILGITAIVFSRTMLASLDDPEGPNLLIVLLMAGVVYFTSLTLYKYTLTVRYIERFASILPTTFSKLIVIALIQLLLVTLFYFCLR